MMPVTEHHPHAALPDAKRKVSSLAKFATLGLVCHAGPLEAIGGRSISSGLTQKGTWQHYKARCWGSVHCWREAGGLMPI